MRTVLCLFALLSPTFLAGRRRKRSPNPFAPTPGPVTFLVGSGRIGTDVVG